MMPAPEESPEQPDDARWMREALRMAEAALEAEMAYVRVGIVEKADKKPSDPMLDAMVDNDADVQECRKRLANACFDRYRAEALASAVRFLVDSRKAWGWPPSATTPETASV